VYGSEGGRDGLVCIEVLSIITEQQHTYTTLRRQGVLVLVGELVVCGKSQISKSQLIDKLGPNI
jgi:hypothetical protein